MGKVKVKVKVKEMTTTEVKAAVKAATIITGISPPLFPAYQVTLLDSK